MNQTRIIEPNKQQWQAATGQFEQANFLMSWAYGQAQADGGSKVERRLIYHPKSEQAIVAIQAVVRDARRGRYLELQGNPLVANPKLWRLVLELVKRIAKKHSCSFIRLQPPLLADQQPDLRNFGLRRASMFLNIPTTAILDLKPSQEELLAGMRRQTRYRVRSAEREGIVIKQDSAQANFDKLLELIAQTAKRNKFVPIGATKTRQLYNQLKAEHHLKLYQAYNKEGELLAIAFIASWQKEADYFLGASTAQAAKQSGAALLQWRAILDAKAAGRERYNFWGVAPEDKPKHALAGITTFKLGFGGERVSWQTAYDIILKPLPYLLTYTVERLEQIKRWLR